MKQFLPPHAFVASLALGVTLHFLLPVVQLISSPYNIAGAFILLIGVGFLALGSRRFIEVATNFNTFIDPDTLVTSGPFRVTRNPMYLGFCLILLGAAVSLGSLTVFVAPVVFFSIANTWYIPFEEVRCRQTFGDRYEAYQQQVRRWL